MNEQELQLAVIGYIMATKKQPKSEQEVQAIAQEVAGMKQSNPQQYQQLVQMGQQAQQQQAGAKVAALGAKLNYIRKIKGLCPEGEELVYMKQGGRVCPVCQKKRQEKVEMNQKGNAITKFKDSRKEDKYDVNEHNNLIRKFRNKTISKEELDRLHNLNKHPNTTHEESDWATERPKPKNITNKKKLVDKKACGSKMKKK